VQGPRSKNPRRAALRAQVALEMALVFVSLAVLTAGAMRLFSNLNNNVIDRVEKYRSDRLNAVNGWTASSPQDFLYYSPNDIIIGGGSSGGGSFNTIFYEDPRVFSGDIQLEEMSLIENLILPFKFNQMQALSVKLVWVHGRWNHPELITEIKTLATESRIHSNLALSKFRGAINNYQAALDRPLVPGPFDPDPDQHPELYGLDPNELNPNDPNYQRQLEQLQRQIDILKRENEANRQRLQQTIDGLERQLPALSDFFNKEVIPRLNYIALYIGETYCWWWCYPSSRHNAAVIKINELAQFSGEGSVPYPILSLGLVQRIEAVYNITRQANPTSRQITAARNIATNMLLDNQVKATPMLNDVTTRLYRFLDYALRYWEDKEQRDYNLGYSRVMSWGQYEITDINRMLDE